LDVAGAAGIQHMVVRSLWIGVEVWSGAGEL